MKKIVKTGLKASAILIMLMLLSGNTNAQPNPGPGNQHSGIGPAVDGPQVPFDGGMSLMFAASGIGYVAKKLKKK
jgi:hypothetical protein